MNALSNKLSIYQVLGVMLMSLVLLPASAKAEEKEVRSVNFVKVSDEAEPAQKPEKTPVRPELYPEGALRQAYDEEIREWKAAEEREAQAAKLHEEYEKRKVEAEQEIAAKKFRINDYKMRQDKAAFDVDVLKADIEILDKQQSETEVELSAVEKIAKDQIYQAESSSKELSEKQKNLTGTLEKLRAARDESAKNLNKIQIDMQRIRAEIAVLESDVARTENEKVRYDADTTTYSQAHQKIQIERSRALAELDEMKSKLNLSKADFNKAKSEYEKAKKDQIAFESMARNERSNIANQMKKLRTDTQQLAVMREEAINTKDRMDVDVQKLKTELALVKSRNEEARQRLTDQNQAVMESRLALEEAKTDLTEEMATGAAGRWKHDTMGFKMRSLASVAETSDMISGDSKPWVVKKSCQIVKSPSSKKEVGSVKKDDRLIASPAGSYVKIMNSSGQAAYVDSSCGEFSE